MTYPTSLTNPAQANWPVVVNENGIASAAQAMYARNYATSAGLTLGYFGGHIAGTVIADGTVALTASATNYVVAHRTTGAVTAATSTTNWNNTSTYGRLFKATTGASTVTAIEDWRQQAGGWFDLAAAGSGGTVTSVAASVPAFLAVAGSPVTTSGTLAISYSGTGLPVANGGTGATDAATARTNLGVDTAISAAVAGLSWKQAVRAATTVAGTLATSFENGDTIDGVVLATGNRILVKNQAAATENGIYVVAASGAPARATDADSGAELVNASVYVSEGTTLADTQWTCTTNATITVGATNLAFAQLSSGGGVSLTATNVWTKNNSVTPLALTDGATINTDASLSNNFTVTLGGNRTLANPTNLTSSMVLNWRITQDGTGSRTLAYGTKFKWGLGGAGAAPVLSTAANGADLISGYYDSALQVIHCALIGQAGPAGTNGTNGTNGAGTTNSVSGRLTLESGVPISTTDQTAKTTVYWTPYKGNEIMLWSGSAWTSYVFTETSLALGTLTSGKNYDVFGYQSGGTLTLELLAWTNDTTRATAVTMQDGRYCKSGDKTRLYLGIFRTTSTTTTEDSAGGTTSQVGGKRFVWNYYNRVDAAAHVIDTTDSWAYTTDTIRQANAAAGNKIEFVVGIAEDYVTANVVVPVYQTLSTTLVAKAGVGVDSTTTFSGLVTGAFNGNSGAVYGNLTGLYRGIPAAGYHYFAWCEKGGDGTTLMLGDNGANGIQSGLNAMLTR